MAEDTKLPALRPSRLPWHPAFEEYGIDRTGWQALVEGVFPAAQSIDSIRMALSYCKARKLDPFKRVVHIVPIWDASRRSYIETVWPGIAELRTTAFRTRQYAGADPAEFGPTVEHEWRDTDDVTVTVAYPAWAQMTVYRLIDGQRMPLPGPRCYWMETYSRKGRTDVPNERWQRAPFQMIEKCAEAAALRRAFPEELGDQHTEDEAGAMRDVTPAPPPAPAQPVAEQPQMGPALSGTEALRQRLVQKAAQPPQERAETPEAPEHAEQQDAPSVARAAAAAPRPEAPPPDHPPEETSPTVDPTTPPAGAPTEPEEVRTFEPIKPTRLRRGGWDWTAYANDYIAAGTRLPVEQLATFRAANAGMFDALRRSDKEEWSRVSQAMAEYERDGVLPE